MSRTLTGLQVLAYDTYDSVPMYLVEVSLDQEYYWSTHSRRYWDGHDWEPGLIDEVIITGSEAVVRIRNVDHVHTQNAAYGVYHHRQVRIWSAWLTPHAIEHTDPDYWTEEYPTVLRAMSPPILLVEGIIGGFGDTIDEWLNIQVIPDVEVEYPLERVRPPKANHLPGDGYMLEFDGRLLRVEGGE